MKPSRWLPLIVGAWGVVTTLSGLVESFGGLVAIRFTLGLCEGGLLPGIVSTGVVTSFDTASYELVTSCFADTVS